MESCCFYRRDSRGRLETGQIKTARSISRTRRFLRWAPAGLNCSGLSLAPLGSKAEVTASPSHVRSYPNNRHASACSPCPFSAKPRHHAGSEPLFQKSASGNLRLVWSTFGAPFTKVVQRG